MVAWADTRNIYATQAGFGPISPLPLWRSTRNFTQEVNAHNFRNISAEQHVYWQEQGRQAWNFKHASFKSAVQESEQAARDEVHDAVAQATDMSGAETREMMDGLENKAEQTWTSHQVT